MIEIIFSRQDARNEKAFLGKLSVFDYIEAGEGRKQAVPVHPALTAFVHPYHSQYRYFVAIL